MSTSLYFEWFQRLFIPKIQHLRKKHNYYGPAVLLMDNCAVHSDVSEVDNLCIENNIRIVKFVPHATNFLQMLDVGIFSLQKRIKNDSMSTSTEIDHCFFIGNDNSLIVENNDMTTYEKYKEHNTIKLRDSMANEFVSINKFHSINGRKKIIISSDKEKEIQDNVLRTTSNDLSTLFDTDIASKKLFTNILNIIVSFERACSLFTVRNSFRQCGIEPVVTLNGTFCRANPLLARELWNRPDIIEMLRSFPVRDIPDCRVEPIKCLQSYELPSKIKKLELKKLEEEEKKRIKESRKSETKRRKKTTQLKPIENKDPQVELINVVEVEDKLDHYDDLIRLDDQLSEVGCQSKLDHHDDSIVSIENEKRLENEQSHSDSEKKPQKNSESKELSKKRSRTRRRNTRLFKKLLMQQKSEL